MLSGSLRGSPAGHWRIWWTIVITLVIGSLVLTALMAFVWKPETVAQRGTRFYTAPHSTTYVPTPSQAASPQRSTRSAPVPGPGIVWVNTRSHIYHFPGYALASGADEALLMAAGMFFDVLLTDVYMPRLSGWRLVRQLKAEGHLPAWVVSMSASGAALEAVQSCMAGCDVHLQKPFNIEELTEALSYPGSGEPNAHPIDPPQPKDKAG